MENRRLKFGYEDIYKKIEIEIFGLVFEINKQKIEDSDIKDIDEESEDVIERKIEEVIGEGAIERINNKAISDGHKKMTLAEEIKILTFLYTTYMNYITNGIVNEIENKEKEIKEKVNVIRNNGNLDREERRNYNRNQYRRSRKGYRRY